jgi:hypothetical protein
MLLDKLESYEASVELTNLCALGESLVEVLNVEGFCARTS